jgi:GT2 family glycosyltransferase
VVLYNDIDLCLKIREKGYLIVWTPFAELYHYECVTRGYARTTAQQARDHFEHVLYQWKWQSTLDGGDRYYSPNLTVMAEDCSLRT